MSKTVKVLGLAMLIVGFAAVAGADHHEAPSTYVWVSFVKAQPGQAEALTGLLMEDAAVYDPLVESGAALEWGIGMPIVHDGGDSGVRVQWVTFVGWDGADQFMSAFMTRMQAMSEDQRKSMDEKWQSIVVPGSHMDMINRDVHVGAGQMTRPAYIHLDYRTALPGQEMAATAFYKEKVAPIYDKLVADGKIQNYGLHVPAIHRGQPWTHMSWYTSSNLAARDAEASAFGALSAAEMGEWMSRMNEILEPGFEEQIMMVVHHKAASGGGG